MFVRNPMSIRPYQFVLEPLILYLNILAMQRKDAKFEGHYNIGPDKKDCLTTKELVNRFYEAVDNKVAKVIYNQVKQKNAKHEAAFLRLDNNLIKKKFKYKEIFSMKDTMKYTAKVYLDMLIGENLFDSVVDILDQV